jgi:proline iminopeptidase
VARIENHYMANHGWLQEGQLLEGAKKLKGIPGVIVQGRHDTCTPPVAAWRLKQAWPEVELNIIPDAGHLFNEPGNLDALVRATDRFAGVSG